MRILFDIYHLPQLNFFKNAIKALGPEKVDLVCVNRGKLVQIIDRELKGYNLMVFGDYKYNKGMISMIFRIVVPRLFSLFRFISAKKYSLVVSAGSAYQTSFVSRLKGLPSLAFSDDPRWLTFKIAIFFSSEFFTPPVNSKSKAVTEFNALKEWAYLSPEYFNPDISALKEYNLQPGEYIFIRDVSTSTLNYKNQSADKVLDIAPYIKEKVVLSLEEKAKAHLFPKHWTILKEPVIDIHSLMYFSKLVISSGDSVAREGGMLGVPSVYLGDREMPANRIMIEEGILIKFSVADFLASYKNKELRMSRSQKEKEAFRTRLNEKWQDVTKLILRQIKKYDHGRKK